MSERLVAEALYPYEGVVVATKGGLTRRGPSLWSRNGRPEHLRSACEGSLRRLRIERVPLYQLHAVDPAVPIEESVGGLVELREEGKIEHIGVCNVSVPELERALAVTQIASVQNRFNAGDRGSRRCWRYANNSVFPSSRGLRSRAGCSQGCGPHAERDAASEQRRPRSHSRGSCRDPR